ncbi:hypothetical protein TSOC_000895 [Tetrabaena socialis]|uniref:Uncharacterized protein n=1 Tax=Tetrabaena socialis TaxID=47790 RepID=A0A2J8AI65_9CHLO|nr:hypothetical protein TSOC_000895 [Tetrabaena socialis]|eukprot:PNH12213.1 hypothetical protein TSOC_000895 [Tetrabaena socialis]
MMAKMRESPDNGQAGLDVAAAELWLFGLASAHVITKKSAYGRLGALAGGTGPALPGMAGEPYRLYGINSPYDKRECRLESPDRLANISNWWIGVR